MRFRRSPGGLVAALDPVMTRCGGDWIGWPGLETSAPESAAEMEAPDPQSNGVRYHPVLLAKEYVASQIDQGGVLILSELPGAAEELKEAILVNPYDVDEVADALHRALTMPEDERRAHLLALRHRILTGDVQAWVKRFVRAAEKAAV